MTDLDIDSAIWHLKGTPEDFALARRLIRRVFAASVPVEAIGKLLHEAIEQAAANGANSISMPDDLVEIAVFLSTENRP